MIITQYNPPCIPCRDWDWRAHYQEQETVPGCIKPAVNVDTGEPDIWFGPTEQQAVQLLIDNGILGQ